MSTHFFFRWQGRHACGPPSSCSAPRRIALERYLGRADAARFVRIIDSGFDVLNAGHPLDAKPFRRGYRGAPEQEEALTALQRGGGVEESLGPDVFRCNSNVVYKLRVTARAMIALFYVT